MKSLVSSDLDTSPSLSRARLHQLKYVLKNSGVKVQSVTSTKTATKPCRSIRGLTVNIRNAQGILSASAKQRSTVMVKMSSTDDVKKAIPEPDYRFIQQPLDSLLGALVLKVQREWPPRFKKLLGGQQLILMLLQTASITYSSIRYLAIDTTSDPYRKREFSLSISPLNRTILDNLFTLLFIFEDFPTRCRWYWKADWRECRRELIRNQDRFGGRIDNEEWIGRLKALSDVAIEPFGISSEEVANPKMIPSWPNPGSMSNYGMKEGSILPPIRAFLKYLDEWFYADLSQQAHLAGGGLGKRAGVLLHWSGTEKGGCPTFS